MDEVEAVARVIDPDVWADDGPVPTRGHVLTFHERRQKSCQIARAAIAALDACRSDTVVLHPTAPQLRQALEMVGADRAAMERRLETALREGREAGLREAAAAVERMRPAATPTWIMPRMAREILALIDAGATPGPSQPEPGACVSPDHEGA